MIITQTPFRMSFFGGGTDFPDFYKKHGGAVISTTFGLISTPVICTPCLAAMMAVGRPM